MNQITEKEREFIENKLKMTTRTQWEKGGYKNQWTSP